jgi:hypothetical protein
MRKIEVAIERQRDMSCSRKAAEKTLYRFN